MTGEPPAFTRIGIVVPAKNEEALLPECLRALGLAAAMTSVEVSIVVVLDGCSDDSHRVAAQFADTCGLSLRIEAVAVNSVGAARSHGMRRLLESGPDGLWLATTDADSCVPAHWLSAQLAHARRGAAVVLGTVGVADWAGRPDVVRLRAIEDYVAHGHNHVHGANMGFSAEAYLRAGGFAGLACDEDVTLVGEFVRAGEPIAWALDLEVTTSARRSARAPAGFAGYLDLLESEAELAEPTRQSGQRQSGQRQSGQRQSGRRQTADAG